MRTQLVVVFVAAIRGAASSAAPSSIPVIDIGNIIKGCASAEDIAAVGAACASPGFFHVTNHGIDDATIARFDAALRQFFALPLATKRQVKRTETNSRGYADDEFTKRTRDLKEIYDYGHTPAPELPADAVENRVLDGYNQLPAGEAEFAAAIACYYGACADVCQALLRAVAASLGLEHDALDALFAQHTSYLRINKYPKCEGVSRFVSTSAHLDLERAAAGSSADLASTPLSALRGDRLGVNRHFDAGALTLLRQDDACSALQVNVCAHDGDDAQPRWVDVSPVPGALTVNVGDMLQVLSNDAYKAPEHRVLASQQRERYSAPFFYNPAYAAAVEPRGHERPRFRPFSWGHFRTRRFQGDFKDEGRPEIQIADFRL